MVFAEEGRERYSPLALFLGAAVSIRSAKHGHFAFCTPGLAQDLQAHRRCMVISQLQANTVFFAS